MIKMRWTLDDQGCLTGAWMTTPKQEMTPGGQVEQVLARRSVRPNERIGALRHMQQLLLTLLPIKRQAW
ncbi:MAG: hypothetical protein NVS4B8_15320 [Herpetosiphon sp.]